MLEFFLKCWCLLSNRTTELHQAIFVTSYLLMFSHDLSVLVISVLWLFLVCGWSRMANVRIPLQLHLNGINFHSILDRLPLLTVLRISWRRTCLINLLNELFCDIYANDINICDYKFYSFKTLLFTRIYIMPLFINNYSILYVILYSLLNKCGF